MCYLFSADDRSAKRDVKTVDTRSLLQQIRYAFTTVMPHASLRRRIAKVIGVAAAGLKAARELIQIRCERGASIARQFALSEETALAIHSLDEHWDGGGHPEGRKGEQIPLLARILCLSQTAEVFLTKYGHRAMVDMARERSGTWFEPRLVKALLSVAKESNFAEEMQGDPRTRLSAYEPTDREMFADDARLDRIAEGFGKVIDAKSPWTFRHSRGVAEVAVGIADVIGLPTRTIRDMRNAALLHDIGKLGISNLILDKPGKLTPEEFTEVRRHPEFTFSILQKVTGFSELAEFAASHHERIDGKGYHHGLSGAQLTIPIRILAVSDMYEALAAKRPYRQDLTEEEVMTILNKNAGPGLCPAMLDKLKVFLTQSGFVPYKVAA